MKQAVANFLKSWDQTLSCSHHLYAIISSNDFILEYQAIWSMSLYKEGGFIKYFVHLQHVVNAPVIDKMQSVKCM